MKRSTDFLKNFLTTIMKHCNSVMKSEIHLFTKHEKCNRTPYSTVARIVDLNFATYMFPYLQNSYLLPYSCFILFENIEMRIKNYSIATCRFFRNRWRARKMKDIRQLNPPQSTCSIDRTDAGGKSSNPC